MEYNEALSYIHSAPRGLESTDLERMRLLMKGLGDPQNALKFVHAAGTNGKGSTCAMLASILGAAGLSVGLFTSPYLRVFNERIQLGGVPVSDGDVAALAEQVKAAADDAGVTPSQFELVTAMGFLYFAREKCDIVVLEVGLGGRLDATNVIPCPECAVICNIGLDHTEILGSTLTAIAAEKAGIIKEGCSVAVYQPEDDDVTDLLARICRERGATLRIAEFDELLLMKESLSGSRFCYCDDTPLTLPLLGEHQLRNAAVVLEAVELLREKGWEIPQEAVEQGLASVRWPARFEIVSKKPYFVVDGGHNPQCAQALAENLDEYFPDSRRIILIGMVRDKDVSGFADIISDAADVFVCVTPDSARALEAAELGKLLAKYEKPVIICESIPEAVETARTAARDGGMVCATGSLYICGAVRSCFGLE